jgi:protein canopy 1/2
MRLLCTLPLLAAVASAGVPNFSKLKCEACEAVVDELDSVLRAEASSVEGRMGIEVGGRLDSKGKRQGKVISYEMSEMRAMEVLESLCQGVAHYRSVEGDRKGRFWFSRMKDYHDRGTLEIPEAEHEEDMKRSLKVFCGAMVEEYEELLTTVIQRGAPGRRADAPKAEPERRDWLVSTPLHEELCAGAEGGGWCNKYKAAGEMGWFRKEPIYLTLLVKNCRMGDLLPRFGDAPSRVAGRAELAPTGAPGTNLMMKAMEEAIADAKVLAQGRQLGDDAPRAADDGGQAKGKGKKKGKKKKKKKKTKTTKKAKKAKQDEL